MKETNIQCDTCERMLKENELPENRDRNRTPIPTRPRRKRMFYLLC